MNVNERERVDGGGDRDPNLDRGRREKGAPKA